MAFLGKFTEADGNTVASVTSGSRTSTSGSLVIGGGASWNSPAKSLDITSSLAGTYTEAFEEVFSTEATYVFTYNIGGTRGASHTLTCTPTSGTVSQSVSGAEFDGIDASPTVTIGTVASGTSTSPSCSVTIPSGTATVVAIMAYDGSPTTITVSNGSEATEADENNDNQAHAMAYKIGQTGTVTIAWTLGASVEWSCRAVAFSEPASGTVKRLSLLGVG
jgi:hypothetical protein